MKRMVKRFCVGLVLLALGVFGRVYEDLWIDLFGSIQRESGISDMSPYSPKKTKEHAPIHTRLIVDYPCAVKLGAQIPIGITVKQFKFVRPVVPGETSRMTAEQVLGKEGEPYLEEVKRLGWKVTLSLDGSGLDWRGGTQSRAVADPNTALPIRWEFAPVAAVSNPGDITVILRLVSMFDQANWNETIDQVFVDLKPKGTCAGKVVGAGGADDVSFDLDVEDRYPLPRPIVRVVSTLLGVVGGLITVIDGVLLLVGLGQQVGVFEKPAVAVAAPPPKKPDQAPARAPSEKTVGEQAALEESVKRQEGETGGGGI